MIPAVAGLVAFGGLLAGGALHALSPRRTSDALHRQALWPPRLVPVLAAALPVGELALGIAGCAALLTASAAAPPLAAAAAAVYAGFTALVVVLLRSRPGAPCGCDLDVSPASWATLMRPALLGTLAAWSAAADAAVDHTLAASAITVLAAGAFTVVIWRLPAIISLSTEVR